MNKENLKKVLRMTTIKTIPIPTKTPGLGQKKTNYLDTFCGNEESRIMFRYRFYIYINNPIEIMSQ